MCQINIFLSRMYHMSQLNSFLLTSLVSKDTKLNEYIIQNLLSHWMISFHEIYTQPMHCPSVHISSQVFEKMLVTIHHHKNWTCYKTFHKASVLAFLTSTPRWWRVDTSPGWKPPWYPLNRRHGPQGWFECFREQVNFLILRCVIPVVCLNYRKG